MAGERRTQRPSAMLQAVCRQILLRHGFDAARAGEQAASAAAFVVAVLGRQPPWIRGAVVVLGWAFGAAAFLCGGRVFARRTDAFQRRFLGAWADGPLPPCRLYVRFVESLVLAGAHAPIRGAGPARIEGRGNVRRGGAVPRTQVVVVGSGPGGTMAALQLAQAGQEVLLIEEGDAAPMQPAPPFSTEEMLDRCRQGGIGLALGPSPVPYMEGRGLGGGSEINSGFFHRTPAPTLARWAQEFALLGASPEAMREHFDACEALLGAQVFPGLAPAASERLAAGAAMLGWKVARIPKARAYAADAPWSDDDRAPYRSISRSLLPAYAAHGGRVVCATRALRLQREGRGWAVDARQDGRPISIHADRVVVAGGAIQTPLLLRRSGIRRNVGNSLALQPVLKVVAEFDVAVNEPGLGIGEHQVREFAPRLTLACGVSSPAQLALALAGYPAARMRLRDTWTRMAIYTVMLAGEGRGSVRNIPGSAHPLVRYALPRADWLALGFGLQRLGELLFAAGALRLYPALALDAPLRSAAELARLPDDISVLAPRIASVHLTSSCPMGENTDRCAVDSRGAVRGASGLYIADASLLCTAPGVNPQGSIMAFARRNALTLAESRG